MKRLLLACCLAWRLGANAAPLSTASADDPFPDDHADQPDQATALQPGSAPLPCNIEIDPDQDWFRFLALPDVSYRIDVASDTLWDTALELRGPDRIAVLAAADSSRAAPPVRATAVCTNNGAAALYCLGISGYLKFTTGLCWVAVQPLNWTDTDNDGLLDAWELDRLGTLTWRADDDPDGDGADNRHEYYARTHPAQAASVLAITSLVVRAAQAELGWPGAPGAAYRIWRTPGLAPPGPAWTAVGTNVNPGEAGRDERWTDSAPGVGHGYRIDLILAE